MQQQKQHLHFSFGNGRNGNGRRGRTTATATTREIMTTTPTTMTIAAERQRRHSIASFLSPEPKRSMPHTTVNTNVTNDLSPFSHPSWSTRRRNRRRRRRLDDQNENNNGMEGNDAEAEEGGGGDAVDEDDGVNKNADNNMNEEQDQQDDVSVQEEEDENSDEQQQEQQQQDQDNGDVGNVEDDGVHNTNNYDDDDTTDAWEKLYGSVDDYYEEDFSMWYEKDAEDYRRVFSQQVSSTVDPPVSPLVVSLCFCLSLVLLVPLVLAIRKSIIARRKQRQRLQQKEQQQQKVHDGYDEYGAEAAVVAAESASASEVEIVNAVAETAGEDLTHQNATDGGRGDGCDGANILSSENEIISDYVAMRDPTSTGGSEQSKHRYRPNLLPPHGSDGIINVDDEGENDNISTYDSSVDAVNSRSFYMGVGDPNVILRDFAAIFTGKNSDRPARKKENKAFSTGEETNHADFDGEDEDEDDDDDSLASGWIEQYDNRKRKTVYCSIASGQIVLNKPVGDVEPPSEAWSDEGLNITASSFESHIYADHPLDTGSMLNTSQFSQKSIIKSIGSVSSQLSTNISSREIDILYGPRPWYFYYCSGRFLHKLRKCTRYDDEMKSILSLTIPFLTHAVVVDIFGLMEVGVIGRLLGTRALSAFFAVELIIEVATMLLRGLPTSLNTLVPQSIGAGNYRLAGLYTQLCVWSYEILYLPIILFWWNKFDGIVMWLGFDEETSISAQQYAEFAMICKAVKIFDEALHCVLNAAGFQAYSTFMNGMKAFLSFMMIVMISSLYREEDQQQLEDGEQSEEQIQERWATEEEDEEEEPGIQASLWMIGAIHLVLTLFFLLSNVTIIACNGLLTRCWKGMVPWRTNPISKLRPIKTYFSAAIPLSVGYLFKYCEFQLLFLFAVIMGPAEVAAWGLLGAIWRVTEGLAIAISTASKIRVANLLGSGRPYQAKYSSEKSLFWSVLFSSALSTVLGIFQSDVPRWFTHDETLQELVEHEIPLLCLGVALMSFASMAWAHLCAQGRSYLASGVAILGSILITLPLVLVSTFYLSYGLQGLLTAMILGYAASAFVCTLLVLTSNWTAISRRVMKWNYRRQRQLKEEKKIDEVGNRLSQK